MKVSRLSNQSLNSHNTPAGLGRVKVAFNWASGSSTSEWMRMMQPHSGAGKGFYFIPEIGEEVLVGFEGNNAQNPYVLGSQYNGSESSGYADGENNVKAIHTRSGTKIIMNDSEGSILIEDPSGNTYSMDGQGNIVVTAPKNMTFEVGEDLIINVGKNMTTQVGEDSTMDVGKNQTITVTEKLNLQAQEYKQSIDENKTVTIGGDLKETTATTTHKAIGGDIIIKSAGVAKLLGATDAKVNIG
ncbi:phage baseplate assembly protein V [Flavobacterium sp. PL002]|uniref:phage baseplate assembly protein V n=1 Tax=Flavobacterium sp. PL002 TaxID=1897058 RepID=UPI0019EAEA49|nr:phage baseplate assembly protein V [Flavobacterium sp. PL002]MBE0392679.1 Actin cross-linking toxin VgrG1 [Flavobacterium sp. PL002]